MLKRSIEARVGVEIVRHCDDEEGDEDEGGRKLFDSQVSQHGELGEHEGGDDAGVHVRPETAAALPFRHVHVERLKQKKNKKKKSRG